MKINPQSSSAGLGYIAVLGVILSSGALAHASDAAATDQSEQVKHETAAAVIGKLKKNDEITYSNGDRYVGETKDGIPMGKGTYSYSTGERYEGGFLAGKKSGEGKFFYPTGGRFEGTYLEGKAVGKGILFYDDGSRYEGDYIDGKRTGEGTLFYANGTRYEGSFVNGKRDGNGVFFYAGDRQRYEGAWVNDKRVGKGQYIYASGRVEKMDYGSGQIAAAPEGFAAGPASPAAKIKDNDEINYDDGGRYVGQTLNGKLHGQGALFFPNGSRYEGEFLNNKFHGEGIFISAKGSRYEGSWVNGKKNGKGKITYSGGGSYEGDWVDDLRSGQGIYEYGSDRYEGGWLKNVKSGKGKEFWRSELIYEGDFLKNFRNGKGTYNTKDGRYEGDFRNNVMTGYGIYYLDDGNRYEGDFVSGERTGKGKLYYADGKRYEGDFVNSEKHGKGTLYFKNGNRYVGDFVHNERTGKADYYWSRGHHYEGDFVKGIMTGMGKYTFASGERYEGRFNNNKREGWGTYRDEDGKVEKRYFVYDEMMSKDYNPNSYAREYTSQSVRSQSTERGSSGIVAFADKLDAWRTEANKTPAQKAQEERERAYYLTNPTRTSKPRSSSRTSTSTSSRPSTSSSRRSSDTPSLPTLESFDRYHVIAEECIQKTMFTPEGSTDFEQEFHLYYNFPKVRRQSDLEDAGRNTEDLDAISQDIRAALRRAAEDDRLGSNGYKLQGQMECQTRRKYFVDRYEAEKYAADLETFKFDEFADEYARNQHNMTPVVHKKFVTFDLRETSSSDIQRLYKDSFQLGQ